MECLIETRHVATNEYREVAIDRGHQQFEDPNGWLFLPQTTGGSLALPNSAAGQEHSQLYWHLQNHTTSTLSLAEVSLTQGQVGKGVKLHIPGQVFTAVAHHLDADACYLFLLFSSKSLGILRLPFPRQAQQGQQQQQRATMLDAVQSRSLLQLNLSQQLATTGVPTALVAADGYLCIAGSQGGVTGFPLAALTSGQDPQQGTVLQLNPSNLLNQVRRRMGFAASSSVVAALPVSVSAAEVAEAAGPQQHQSLLVVHDDSSCHQWWVRHARQGYSQTLVSDAAARQLRPNKVLLCMNVLDSSVTDSRRPTWDVLLVWDMVVADSSGQSDVRIMPYKLQQGVPVAAARLEPQLQQPQQLALEWPDASLVDARVVGQHLLLLCRRATGRAFIVSYSCRDWGYKGKSQLLQQKVTSGWGMTEELWSCALAAVPESTSPAEQVMGQLLVPGQLCMTSLRQALAYHGTQLTEQEAATASLTQLKVRISAAVELLMSKYPSYSPARCWHMLFASYCEAWQQQHPLLGLYSSPQGGWLGAVRSGGLLTLLRKPSPAEVLLADSSAAALEHVQQVVGSQGTSGIPGGTVALAKVRWCLSAIEDILGKPAMRVMTQLVMEGVPVEGQLLPKFVELLLQGPTVAAAESASGVAAFSGTQQYQGLSDWRMHRQARLLFVHEQLSELPHALETLSGVADLAIKTAVAAASQLQPPATAHPSSAPAPQLTASLSTIALHVIRASCKNLQQLLLLLGCLSQLGSVGTTPLTAADQAAIQSDLIPPLAAALRSAAVALWLCKTPASTAVTGAGAASGSTVNPALLGPLLGLRVPTPSGTPASTPRGGGDVAAVAGSFGASAAGAATAAGHAAHWHNSLAAHLLPLFWKQHAVETSRLGRRVGALGDQLAVWLTLGVSAADGDTGSPGVARDISSAYRTITSSQDLAARAVMIGYQLFICREYEAMRKLVRLIGGEDPSEPGLQFILGLSIACGIKQGAGKAVNAEQRAALLDSAVGHLFRAAAGLCGEEAAPLRLVLQLLRQRQSSGTAAATASMEELHIADHHDSNAAVQGAALKEAKVRLEYCQAVMSLFEREGITEGALAFARAALGVVDAAYAADQKQDRLQQQDSLWTRVFNFASELGLYQDAYTAAISNPVPEKSADAVSRLVQALVERQELAQLLMLPWSGVVLLERKGIREPVPVVQLVIDKLERRALHSDLSQQPSAYHVLYDFLVSWSNYKHAAAAMLGYARRLRAAAAGGRVGQFGDDAVIQEIQAAYGASVALLQILDPADAWLDADQPLLANYPVQLPRSRTTQHNSSTGLGKTFGMLQDAAVTTLTAINQEAQLFSASTLLLNTLPGLEVMQYNLTAEYVVEQLLGSQQFAAAVRLIHVMWGDKQQQVAERLEAVAFDLAGSCVKLQASYGREDMGIDSSSQDDSDLQQSMMSYTGPGYLGSSAAPAWHKLRKFLELYDRTDPPANGSGKNDSIISGLGGRLRLAAVDGALSAQPELQLPAWLLQPFSPMIGHPGGMAGCGADPAVLLRIYIKHGRLIDAAQLLKEHMDAWQHQGPLLRAQPAAVWMPLQDMRLLHASLVAGAQRATAAQRMHEAEVLGVWSEVLERGLGDHMALIRSDGDKLGRPSSATNGAVGMVF